MTKKRGLAKGRGLDALLGGLQREQATIAEIQNDFSEQKTDHADSSPEKGELGKGVKRQKSAQLQQISVKLLQRGEYQPRQYLGESELAELAESIKKHGIMQPLVVRPIDHERFEIIAGERRWRAAQLAGLTDVPAIVRDIPNQVAIALALIENIQREDLNPIEQALALQRFQDEFELSHQEIADTVGKARATVSNLLRLLSLSQPVKKLLAQQQLDMGHARAILSLPAVQQNMIAQDIIKKGLSVRQTEQLVRQLQQNGQDDNNTKAKFADADIKALTERLADFLAADVQIDHLRQGKGKIVIKYHSLDELDGILNQIGSNKA
ncbi:MULTISPECIES: ParB/RepB/Spo0J family partition protein [unclassified Acinetobacter]|uniref:ParB/RepB/Spo0J family partition protein n=1 Tax=unclassified Acinetobacter TaxID=196816 RepID=UPI0035B6BD2B